MICTSVESPRQPTRCGFLKLATCELYWLAEPVVVACQHSLPGKSGKRNGRREISAAMGAERLLQYVLRSRTTNGWWLLEWQEACR